jgi:hypothetical protein
MTAITFSVALAILGALAALTPEPVTALSVALGMCAALGVVLESLRD